MHDGMQYNPMQGHGQGHEPFKFGNPAVFNIYLLRHLRWELATDNGFLNYGTYLNLLGPDFFIFGLVFVSRDFQVGTHVSCEESTVSTRTGLILKVRINSKSFPWVVRCALGT